MTTRLSKIARRWPHYLIGLGFVLSLCWSIVLVWYLSSLVVSSVRVMIASGFSHDQTRQAVLTAHQSPRSRDPKPVANSVQLSRFWRIRDGKLSQCRLAPLGDQKFAMPTRIGIATSMPSVPYAQRGRKFGY